MQSEEEQFVVAKFKRNGHTINRRSLDRTIKWLNENSDHKIDELLKKLNQLSLGSNNPEQNLQHALEIISRNARGLNSSGIKSYEDLLEETRKRSIYAISPYENSAQSWFCERPQPNLFKFHPAQKLKMQQNFFKRINMNQKEPPKGAILGVLYENFNQFDHEGKQKMMLQNQANEFELSFPSNYSPDCFLIPGCAYIAHGRQEGKDLALKVDSIQLPTQPVEDKNPLNKEKFRQMCQNISAGKQKLGFQPEDFLKYDSIYTPENQKLKYSLVFGNITINNKTVERLKRIVDAYTGVSCIILMLSPEEHESINLGVWFKCKVYLIPHIASEGPRILPKLPLLKAKIQGAKILTNPSKLILEGRQIMLANYPLVKNIFTQNILLNHSHQQSQKELVQKVTDLLFSQGTITFGSQYYWPQTDYFSIHSETILIVNDSTADMKYNRSKGKVGGLGVPGNFERDGNFFALMCSNKTNVVQQSGEQL